MSESYQELASQLTEELIEKAKLKSGDIFVLGLSTSEVSGKTIGKNSSLDIGKEIVGAVSTSLKNHGIHLAVQGCEHINRALVVEKELVQKYNLEEVTVIPALHAGGAGSLSYYNMCEDPTLVEHITGQAGLDIGDTSIGMHIKYVQVPVRLAYKEVGEAHVTALRTRPKLIGGERAQYPD